MKTVGKYARGVNTALVRSVLMKLGMLCLNSARIGKE